MPKWSPNRTAWLVTCVDLTSLLVGFFVLVFSTQTLQRDKWDAMAGSFQQQFAPRMTVVPMTPTGGDNGVIRVSAVKSGLAYLDTLLLQRLEGDPVWGNLQAERVSGNIGQDLRYPLPEPLVTGAMPGAHDAWLRLAGVTRGWKNSVGVRVSVDAAGVGKAAPMAVAMGRNLVDGGANEPFTEIVVASGMVVPKFEFVVRGR
jgi:hypothetical protein